MLDPKQFRDAIVAPTLRELGLWSLAAERLVLGTAMMESNLTYLKQIKGPALGLFQMEPATHKDVWENFLKFRPGLADKVSMVPSRDAMRLMWDLRYACAMCRVHYYRDPWPLPHADDILGLARYWDVVYNKNPTKGFPEEFLKKYIRALQPIYQE